MEANVGVNPLTPACPGVTTGVESGVEEEEHCVLVPVINSLTVGVLVVCFL